ncbi:hypothetical protein G7Y31_11165 [Corynebacterium lizhenjunii]|uniref:Uncharacterized protein n=1 Tax=Corynebacterium lizhenjunii TaxID=2709394 RepID=A0A7T0KE02_9CORY|nr:hypothetical protein [Corynebacterium lizhenjunii]QPK79040.1 hypothetical protein G7Y31_11165 [Corynebacterium lizhenjunii]
MVAADGSSAGECTLSGLPQENVHRTTKQGVYYYALEEGTHTIEASCRGTGGHSSDPDARKGSTEVTVADKPVEVTITVK